ncbi:N-acetylmuramoyl-L-alanine amidase [Vibrio splendidus]|uniref:N-acetylmuramoyl-L-alanine amidase n=1 Tax=Vibrio splendidus TaxID=29497 RepID=UPI000C83BBE0|nr:N-acetylmuramoyl-L-alanine amidase [Vibrio splendidus]PMI54201.1 lysozyme [Vibrio splendidus]PMI72548.1 lysozyme [Vibrio splendidus]
MANRLNKRNQPLRFDWITVHCSATPPNMNIGVKEIQRWHKQRGWRDIGYHWVITRDGELQVGRPMDQMGAHVKGYNRHNIGVCLIGGYNNHLEPQDNFTLAQRKTLFKFIGELQDKFEITDDKVLGHNQWNSSKACPVIGLNSHSDPNNMNAFQ